MVKKQEPVSEAATLSEEDRKALRGSKFAPLPPPSSQQQQLRQHHSQPPRLAHPGGPLKTNKAAALAKFLERKLQEPNGLSNINPDLIERAVNNAKQTVSTRTMTAIVGCYQIYCDCVNLILLGLRGGSSTSGRIIRHVSSFDDSEEEMEEKIENAFPKKKNKKKKKKKKQKVMHDLGCAPLKKPKKKKTA